LNYSTDWRVSPDILENNLRYRQGFVAISKYYLSYLLTLSNPRQIIGLIYMKFSFGTEFAFRVAWDLASAGDGKLRKMRIVARHRSNFPARLPAAFRLGNGVVLRLIPSKAIAPQVRPDSGAKSNSSRPSSSDGMEKEDACKYLFRLCRQLNDDYLQPRGIVCLFDVEGGWLPGKTCRMVGMIIAALVIDIAENSRPNSKAGTVTISLHRWGTVWACSVSDNGICAAVSPRAQQSEIIRQLAQTLKARLVSQTLGDDRTTAFMFEPRF
jgi:hypothetical protein